MCNTWPYHCILNSRNFSCRISTLSCLMSYSQILSILVCFLILHKCLISTACNLLTCILSSYPSFYSITQNRLSDSFLF
jgi:hypothetical protein